jgi:hypothetical protein
MRESGTAWVPGPLMLPTGALPQLPMLFGGIVKGRIDPVRESLMGGTKRLSRRCPRGQRQHCWKLLQAMTSPSRLRICSCRTDGKGQRTPLDFRLTVGLRKVEGGWIIMHEHHSVPAT